MVLVTGASTIHEEDRGRATNQAESETAERLSDLALHLYRRVTRKRIGCHYCMVPCTRIECVKFFRPTKFGQLMFLRRDCHWRVFRIATPHLDDLSTAVLHRPMWICQSLNSTLRRTSRPQLHGPISLRHYKRLISSTYNHSLNSSMSSASNCGRSSSTDGTGAGVPTPAEFGTSA